MIVLPHIGEGNDGTVLRICENIPTDKIIVPITRINDFKFNPELLKHKEAVILDYCEYNWNSDIREVGKHFFGINTNQYKEYFLGEEWDKFDDWAAGLNKTVYFKRELLAGNTGKRTHAIDYPNWVQAQPIQTKEQFDARPLMFFYFFGRSNENRLLLHSDIWKFATTEGYSVCDNIFYFQNFMANESGKKCVSLWQPHYNRIEILNLLAINANAKLSIAMPGAGFKTFRATGESLVNSIVCLPENNLEWSYPLEHGVNCITFGENIMGDIFYALKRDDLYEIYLQGMKLADKYRIDNYVNDYLLPLINNL